ncbi:MAG: hypothetical protein ACFB21_07460 [Opitutales bacterium]
MSDSFQIAPVALPLAAAFIYSVSGLFLKRAMAEGAGLVRVSLIAIGLIGVLFQPLFFFAETGPTWDPWWAPLLCGFLFFGGNVFTFIAIRVGDLSVQTPMMGTKATFVAIAALLLGSGPIPAVWWWAALISAAGVFLLTWRGGAAGKAALKGAAMAMLSAVFFAFADACLSHFAEGFGPLPLVCLMMLSSTLMCLLALPMISTPFSAIPRSAWRWLLPGAGLNAGQTILMGIALSVYQMPTQANILYSSRGLWSVVLVWTVGTWFGNHEGRLGHGVMPRRLIGAALMTVAIILATLG